MLKRRAEVRALWEAAKEFVPDKLGDGAAFSLGCYNTQPRQKPTKTGIFDINTLSGMSQADRDALYIQVCKQAGVSVDPAALARDIRSN